MNEVKEQGLVYDDTYLFDELIGEDESFAFLFFSGALSNPEEQLGVSVQQEYVLYKGSVMRRSAGEWSREKRRGKKRREEERLSE